MPSGPRQIWAGKGHPLATLWEDWKFQTTKAKEAMRRTRSWDRWPSGWWRDGTSLADRKAHRGGEAQREERSGDPDRQLRPLKRAAADLFMAGAKENGILSRQHGEPSSY